VRAGRVTVNYEQPYDLLEPAINIPMGAAFLRQLLDHWNGQILLATASYNGGEGAVKNWVEKRFKGNMLQFIEDIPYQETRDYVKLVLRNFINYLRLNSPKSEIMFPEWTLEGL
jgi:soluble lytic murein transglycosylase